MFLPAEEEKLIILPQLRDCIIGITALENKNVPFKFTPTTKSHSSSSISTTFVGFKTPALFTNISTRP